jgi:hypothetical protein
MGKKRTVLGEIVGLSDGGKVVCLSVERTNSGVVLVSSEGHTLSIHPSNASSVEGFKREAKLACALKDVEYFAEMVGGGASKKVYLSKLREKVG